MRIAQYLCARGAAGLANNGTTTGGVLSVGYYSNDMVASQSQGTLSEAFTLDPAMRLRSATQTGGSTPGGTLNHYSDGTDSPTWTSSTDSTGTTTWQRNVIGLDGSLAALQTSSGSQAPQLQLTNLHCDIIATVDDTANASSTRSTTDTTEFGIPRDAGQVWLGRWQAPLQRRPGRPRPYGREALQPRDWTLPLG